MLGLQKNAALILASVWLLLCLPTWAAGTPTLAGSQLILVKHEFKIFVAGKPKMSKRIEAMLAEQRSTNSKFQNASSISAASKYDQEILYSYLRSQGYYQAKIESKILNEVISHQLVAGPAFTLSDITYNWPDNVALPPADVFGMAVGDRLIADKVLAGVDAVKTWVEANQCLRNIDVGYEATVHHPSRTASIVIHLADSPQVNFGTVSFDGEETIKARYLNLFIGFKEGDCFKPTLLDNTRIKLLQTNLLANVEPQPGDITDGSVPIHFKLTERNQRSIGGGLGYDSDTRGQVSGSWQHRNLLGSGEQLTLDVIYSQLSQTLESEVVVPYFKSEKQRLTLKGIVGEETSDAYTVQKGEAAATVKRKLTQRMSANVGVDLLFSRVKEQQSEDDYALLSFPIGVDYITRNDELDPTQGYSGSLQTQSFSDLYNSARQFTRTSFATSIYFSALKWRLRPTLAWRVSAGTIDGGSLDSIPKDQRYFTGGGGSVRGYSYQSVGPTLEGVPTGGLSYSQTAIELRTRIGQNFGLTLFADGGNTYSHKTPGFGDNYLWGAGIGLRYYTSFAPFRFDIATPLNAREGDNKVQVYVAIGQAF